MRGARPFSRDVIAFNDAHKEQELRYFGQEIMVMAEKKGPLTSVAYKTALAKNLRMARTLGIDAVMTKYSLDALVAPTGGPAWLIDLVNGDGGTSSLPAPSSVAAVAGYPHITVPAGYFRGFRRHVVYRTGMERATLIKLRIRIRAGNQAPSSTHLRIDGRSGR
jgi:Asp-tRNA(Asn)/Glu-tRNA(Gln) amidotransferase A subunit family amidase